MTPIIRSGQIVAMRLIDVAYAIDLRRADALWTQRRRRQSVRAQLSAPPKAMAFGVPPLELALDPVTLEAGICQASVRLYDFGVAAFSLRLAVRDMACGTFINLLDVVEAAVGATAAPVWAGLLATVRDSLAEALERPTVTALEEDYLLGLVHEFDAPMLADEVMDSIDIARLLAGDPRRLSASSRAELLRNRFSYYEDDLVVLGWDRAFLYEPRRDTDVADAIEVANAQLLEMRYYDELLDGELPRMYDLVEATRRTASLLAARRYAKLARRLYGLVAEVTELTERVDNALQVTEDVYLARVYAAAIELFRVPPVSAAVDRKLAIIRDTYAALYSEASGGRSELLEIATLLLIVLEVLISLLVRH
jgi:hypothetical protein